ncbi:hypothetical protein [Chondromyces crocatus]|uniref:PE-PGRS family protein n=1 Tax=Chondromyces crocatus TaxID=52 RepID=A0A0K1EKQ4_CHOCO|nr:hypothetical protein [Chondromyces crocatus]AKT41416.1 uncharacterized protein CMC5_056160 [Chondromyces crocatus]
MRFLAAVTGTKGAQKLALLAMAALGGCAQLLDLDWEPLEAPVTTDTGQGGQFEDGSSGALGGVPSATGSGGAGGAGLEGGGPANVGGHGGAGEAGSSTASTTSSTSGTGGGTTSGGGPDAGTPPPGTCRDGIQNGTETDVDCGGLYCERCREGQHCRENYDCKKGVCAGGVCHKDAFNSHAGGL